MASMRRFSFSFLWMLLAAPIVMLLALGWWLWWCWGVATGRREPLRDDDCVVFRIERRDPAWR